MKTTIKYTVRAIMAILGIAAFFVFVGEPTDSLSLSDVIVLKALALGTLVGAFKGWKLTLSEKERRELEDEQV